MLKTWGVGLGFGGIGFRIWGAVRLKGFWDIGALGFGVLGFACRV